MDPTAVGIIKSFIALFIVLDPIGLLPVFTTLTRKFKKKTRIHLFYESIVIASIILIVFLFSGTFMLNMFGITLNNFKVAGGIILLILGLKIVMGLRITEKRVKSYQIATVPLATPLIAGPAAITTTMLMGATYGHVSTLFALLLNMILYFIVLKNHHILYKLLGQQGSDVVAKIFGLLLTALAVSFIKTGWLAM